MRIYQLNLQKERTFCLETTLREKQIFWKPAYVSGTTKSHKGSKDKEMIQFEKDESHIRTLVEKNEQNFQIDIHLKKIVRKELQ